MPVAEHQLSTPATEAGAPPDRQNPPLRAIDATNSSTEPSLGAWLELVSRMIPGFQAAFAGLDVTADETFTLTAAQPGDTTCDQTIINAAQYARMRETGTAVEALDDATDLIAKRLVVAPAREGVLVVKLQRMPDRSRETLLQLLDWAEAWLGLVMRVPAAPRDVAFQVMDAGLGGATLRSSATAMAALIEATNSAQRVSVGIERNGQVELIAVSHTASFDPRTQLSKDIVTAMEEAIDEEQEIAYPAMDGVSVCVKRAHERLLHAEARSFVCTIVLRNAETIIGALTLESRDPLGQEQWSALQALAPVIGKVLAVKQAIEQPIHSRLVQALGKIRVEVLGPGSVPAKVIAGAALIAFGVLVFVNGDLRVAAPATLEGRVHRTITAPIDGYIAKAPARAGDALKAGDVLAVVDTRTLEFERRRWANERSEFEKANRQAIAKLDRAEAKITKARLGKADSQLALIEAQLARATVTAPFDGLVVSGDLSRSMGAPVDRGDVLFEMAPLDDYRVELEVDERDIAGIMPGQRGYLALAALPGERLPFTIDKVTGVAEAIDGRNIFKVEAKLDGDLPLVRPGMRGVGKITAGETRLLNVWTHQLVDRVRLWVWSRTP